MTKKMTKTKTQTKCLKHPTYAIFLKSWWLTHSKYDDSYLTLVILFTLVTLVTLFQPYNQFYTADKLILTFLIIDLCRSGFILPLFESIIYGNLPFQYTYGFWKESMINRLSNLINRNRSAVKISQALCSNSYIRFDNQVLLWDEQACLLWLPPFGQLLQFFWTFNDESLMTLLKPC